VAPGTGARLGGVNARFWLVAYVAAVVAATFVHDPQWLAAGLLAAVAASGQGRTRRLVRTFWSVLAFNLTVTLGYVVVTTWRGGFVPDYLVLVNLRVFLLVYLGFWFVARVNVLDALRGWPLLTLLATLALSQIRTFTRLLGDFRLAFQSRNPGRARLTDRARHAAAQSGTLLDKSLTSATEAALAMRSRGAFDD
jgi:cobalt/nickel transport system permease protein